MNCDKPDKETAKSLAMFSELLDSFMKESEIRSFPWIRDQTSIPTTMLFKARKGKSLLKNDDAFLVVELIKGDSLHSLLTLKEIPHYAIYANRQIRMIETNGGELAKRGDLRLTHLSAEKFRNTLAFVNVPRSKELIQSRKGSDTLDLINELQKIGVLVEKNGKVTTKKIHFVEDRTSPDVLKNDLDYYSKFPELMSHIRFYMKNVNKEQYAKIENIVNQCLKDLSEIGHDPDGTIGVKLGLYFGLTEQ
jgi:hypothetical protein